MLEADTAALNPFDRLCVVVRWLVDAPIEGNALAERLIKIFRRGDIPTFLSPFGSTQKFLVHPAPAIYHHVVSGTVPVGKLAVEVARWRSALPAYTPAQELA